MINAFEFYSLPEAIRFVINPGNAAISKVVVSGKENLATSSSIYEYNNELSKNADTEILLSMKEWFSKETVEHALFPVHFNSIKFPFVASGNPIGENVIQIKNMELVYEQVSVGVSSLKLLSSLVVYPNPVVDGRAYVALKTDELSITDVSVSVSYTHLTLPTN